MVVGRCGGILGRMGGPGTVEIPEMAAGGDVEGRARLLRQQNAWQPLY
ncbi:MAG: hypothetical protein ACOYXA_05550 [Bacteroidota bacterium]